MFLQTCCVAEQELGWSAQRQESEKAEALAFLATLTSPMPSPPATPVVEASKPDTPAQAAQ